MIKKFKNNFLMTSAVLVGLNFLPSSAHGSDTVKNEQPPSAEEGNAISTPLDLPKVSEAFGHLIGKNLESLGFEFDMNKVIKGIQDSAAGLQSPMSESECIQAISQDQEKKFKKISEENLSKAEDFLKLNSSKDGIISLEENKLQYKIEKMGEGEVVQDHYSPLIRYCGKFLDGKIFGESKEDEMISLDETIPGFSKGIVGMKEGEKRTLYIHPDFGYGTSGYLPPNSLLTFEIEVVKANTVQEQDALSSTTTSSDTEDDSELASEEEQTESVS